MKTLFMTVLAASLLFSASVSMWSAPFLLVNSSGSTSTEKGTYEKSNLLNLSAFPNPFNPVISLRISGFKQSQSVTLQIFDSNGSLVADISPQVKNSFGSVLWDASVMPSGLYVAQIRSGSYIKNLRLALVK